MLKQISLLTLLSGLTAGIAVWQIPTPKVVQPSTVEDNWQLHRLPPPKDMGAIATRLRRLNPWEEREVVATTTTENTSSTLNKPQKIPLKDFVGIVQRGQDSYILLLNKENKAISYQINDTLPNEAQLIAIYKDSIEIKAFDEVETIKLYD